MRTPCGVHDDVCPLRNLLGDSKTKMNIVRNVLIFVVLGCLSLSAQQITGSIRGTVTDPTGAIVEGAKVTAQQSETGLSRTAFSPRGWGVCGPLVRALLGFTPPLPLQ